MKYILKREFTEYWEKAKVETNIAIRDLNIFHIEAQTNPIRVLLYGTNNLAILTNEYLVPPVHNCCPNM